MAWASRDGRMGYLEPGTMPPELLDLPGSERLAYFADGRAPLSGIQLLTGVRPISADPTAAVFEMLVPAALADSDGTLPIGALAPLADGALGWAVTGGLPAGSSCATVGMNLNLSQAPVASGVLQAEAHLVFRDERSAISETVIKDGADRVIAGGRARSAIFARASIGRRAALNGRSGTGRDHAAPPRTNGIAQSVDGVGDLEARDAVRKLRRNGHLTQPVHSLLGLDVLEAASGCVVLAAPADNRLEQTMGAIQGGALALLADRAMVAAVTTTLPPTMTAQLVDIHTMFVRSQLADGQLLHAHATVRHRGRRLGLTSVTILNSAEQTVAYGSGVVALTGPSDA